MITPQELSDFRLVKITYDHTLRDFNLFEKVVDDEEAEKIMAAHRHASVRIRRRNNLVDWIWAKNEDLEGLEDILVSHSMRYKLTDHTKTYYSSPEKLTALRNEVDDFIERCLTTDFVLDRIGIVGIDNISRIERNHIENESKR